MTEDAHAQLRARILLACLLVLLLVVGFQRPGDFESFYIAGGQLLKRLNPYTPELYKSYGSFGMSSLPPAIVLTCLTCLLPLNAALAIWDILCLFLWTASLYLWADLFWGRPTRWSEYARLCTVGFLAPLCWAFATHQVIVPVFFFATLACWAAQRDHPAAVGFASGLMLMKPHLTVLLALFLLLRSQRKLLFVVCLTAGAAILYAPFMNTVRPISDLRSWRQTIQRQQSEVFYLDEQGLSGRLASFVPLVSKADAKASSGPGILIPPSKGRVLSRLKMLFWVFGVGLWAWWIQARGSHVSEISLYALTLTWSLLISPYSHFYDGVMLTPLVFIGFVPRNDNVTFLTICGFNLAFVVLAGLANRYHFYMWSMMGWDSVAYAIFAAVLYKGLLYKTS
jgi:hypothetical protein